MRALTAGVVPMHMLAWRRGAAPVAVVHTVVGAGHIVPQRAQGVDTPATA